MPMEAIMWCRPGALRSGWNTRRSASIAITATTDAAPSHRHQ
jgi:hypothetical protein